MKIILHIYQLVGGASIEYITYNMLYGLKLFKN